MKLSSMLALAIPALAIPATLAVSTSQGRHPSPMPTDLFFLRVNAAREPWHHRHLIQLPTAHTLGLENFTIHPPTPPVLFTPIKLSHGTYALRGAYAGDDLTRRPYIAALTPDSGNGNIAMKVIPLPDPTDEAIRLSPEACPEGYVCKADGWTAQEEGQNGGLTVFGMNGSKGAWEPTKNVGTAGWQVYWKVDGGGEYVHHPIQLDIMPYKGRY